ncbi:formyltetrahydrofolate deformylase [Mycobacterium sp. AZCC_0083]|uniref:formyltetrahydrofolate deformylase n=1 Tax=Mycobacterium sp. AZCC_0083 TaxID=2735882 RepID=UPI00161F14D4|nr:formyltetrahydrofolate deformylase [Mycobacterium sp. AZCC_0083]MBB5168300.1 formyltetrahydrofolate deformylase [Mycobacterium sp. AZCC_0083]
MNAPSRTLYNMHAPTGYVLTVSCPDRPGIIFSLTEFLLTHDCTIVECQQFIDRDAEKFFIRLQFEAAYDVAVELQSLRADFLDLAQRFGMQWRMLHTSAKHRVLIMASKYGHCLNDLLFRTDNGALNIDIVAVVSNHPDLGWMADNYGIPFHHVPVSAATRAEAEGRLLELVDELGVDLVVLARYMQILSNDLCKELEGRAINIHHSMLPSFKGARPYHQAYSRGVKVVGATAHYVTGDLDEGPIIEQEIARVDHSMSAAEVTMLGRDNECLALARAVRWHTENRILLDGARTVVFR